MNVNTNNGTVKAVSELLEVSADCLFLVFVTTATFVIHRQRKSFVYTFIFGILAMSSAGIAGQIMENQGVALNRFQFDALIASSFCLVAAITSPKLCGAIFVAIPTAIPEPPLTSKFGYAAGRTSGSES